MRTVLTLVAAVALVATLAVSSALAQRDAGAKARGDVGKGFWGSSSQQSGMARTYVRRSEPQIAKNDAREDSVQRRSFEPAPQVQKNTGCPGKSSGTYQRRSYEPSTGSSAVRSNASRSSDKPSYLMQKTDPRKYRTH